MRRDVPLVPAVIASPYSCLGSRNNVGLRIDRIADPLSPPSKADGTPVLGRLVRVRQRLSWMTRVTGPGSALVAQDPDLPDREVTSRDGWRMPGSVPLAQAIHHADDHRSHVLSILGARGLAVPEPNGLDVWGYAESAGLMHEIGATSGDSGSSN